MFLLCPGILIFLKKDFMERSSRVGDLWARRRRIDEQAFEQALHRGSSVSDGNATDRTEGSVPVRVREGGRKQEVPTRKRLGTWPVAVPIKKTTRRESRPDRPDRRYRFRRGG